MAGEAEVVDELVSAATALMSARDINSAVATELAAKVWSEVRRRVPALASHLYGANRSIDSKSNTELALTLNRVAISLMAARMFKMDVALQAAETIIKAAVDTAAVTTGVRAA